MNKIQQITCKKCSTVNPLYTSVCLECKSYLRERVVNIDLWKTIGQLIDDTTNAFRQIIFAENKNFIIFISLFLAIKNLIISRFLSVPFLGKEGVSKSFLVSYFMILLFTIMVVSIFTFAQKILYNNFKTHLRFKDIYALNVYAFIPFILSLIFIFPVEVVVLGGDLFSNNPNPFQIKPTISYLLAGFEIVTFLWSIYLLSKEILFISGRIFFTILLTMIFLFALLLMYFISSHLIF
jgi:hypothetical protein